MAEQRVIDSNIDVSKYFEKWECNCSEKIAFSKQTSIPRDQWQDAAEVME